MGVTLSSASVSNDTAAAWALSSMTRTAGQLDPANGTDAVRLTDTVDGAPVVHQITNAPSNQQTGPGMFDVWLKAGTLGWAYIHFAGAGDSAHLDLGNAVAGTLAGVTVQLLSGSAGGWQLWRIRCDDAVAGNMAVRTATADNTSSYQGDGTGTIFVGTGTYGPKFYQDRVSAWADQSGNGNHATQGTAGNQPLFQCLDASGLWVPSSALTNCRIGWPLAASRVLNFPSALATAFNGDNAPITLLVLAQRVTTAAGTSSGVLLSGVPPATVGFLRPVAATNLYRTSWTDDASLTKNPACAGGTSLTPRDDVQLIDSAGVGRMWLGGVEEANDPLDYNVGASTFSAATSNIHGMMWRELIIYKSALSDTNRKRVSNGMRVRAGLPPV